MKSEELLAIKIEDLRTDLETFIEEEKELVDPEIIKASQCLDKLLIQYYRMLGIGVRGILKEIAE